MTSQTTTETYTIHDRLGLEALPIGARLTTADGAQDEHNPYVKTDEGYLASSPDSVAFHPALFAPFEFPMVLDNPEVLEAFRVGAKVRVLTDPDEDSEAGLKLYYDDFKPGIEATVLSPAQSASWRGFDIIRVAFEDGETKYVTPAQIVLASEPIALPPRPEFPEVGSLAVLLRDPSLPYAARDSGGYGKGDVVEIGYVSGSLIGVLSPDGDIAAPHGAHDLWWVYDSELAPYVDPFELADWEKELLADVEAVEAPPALKEGDQVVILVGAQPSRPDLYTEAAATLRAHEGEGAGVVRAEPDFDGDIYVEFGDHDSAYVLPECVMLAPDAEHTDRLFIHGSDIEALPYGSLVVPVGQGVTYVPAIKMSGTRSGLYHANGGEADNYLRFMLEVLYINEDASN